MNLSKRLYTIYQFVPKGAVVADVGADHGKLIMSLVKDGIIHFGYAIENKIGPYKRLFLAIENEKLLDSITPLMSDGIKDLSPDVNTLVLAGMGGLLIVDILGKYPDKLSHVTDIICDAHTANYELRKNVADLGFMIQKETIVFEDNVYYEIIHFVRGHDDYSEDDYSFGPCLRNTKDPLYIQKWNKRLNKIEELLLLDIDGKRRNELLKEKEAILRNI